MRLHPQEQRTTCAVASLRTALDLQFAQDIPEVVLEAFATVAPRPIRIAGSSWSDLRVMLKHANRAYNLGTPWHLRVYTHGTIAGLARCLSHGRFPIVAGAGSPQSDRHLPPVPDPPITTRPVASPDGHAVVVVRVGARHIWYFDPISRKPELSRMTHDRFLDWWRRAYGFTSYVVVLGGEVVDAKMVKRA